MRTLIVVSFVAALATLGFAAGPVSASSNVKICVNGICQQVLSANGGPTDVFGTVCIGLCTTTGNASDVSACTSYSCVYVVEVSGGTAPALGFVCVGPACPA